MYNRGDTINYVVKAEPRSAMSLGTASLSVLQCGRLEKNSTMRAAKARSSLQEFYSGVGL